MKRHHLYIISGILALTSCVTDELPDSAGSNDVTFLAYESIGDDVTTRAITYKPVTFQTYGDETFYIFSRSETDVLEEYKPTSGVSGQLSPVVPGESHVWFNKESKHTFWGWTMPWGDDTYQKGDNPQSTVSFVAKDYEDMGLPRNEYFNCRLLERFVGAKTEPTNYISNGEIVEMNFQHLVSKISIGSVKLISDQGTSTNVNSTMTFYQLPQTAIFDRGTGDDTAPRIIPDPDAKFGVSCSVGSPTQLYVAPNQDFSKMEFSVHVETAAGGKGDFFGDFKSVVFERTNTDQPEWDAGKLPTILYAGEEMTINLTIRQGNAGTVSVSISDWNHVNRGNATGYARKGIYTSSELQDMFNKLSSAANVRDNPELVDDFFNLFGEEVEGPDGTIEKVIYLYEDAEVGNTQLPTSRFLILDGAGHTVKMRTTTHAVQERDENGNVTGTYTSTVFHVGNVRNIYITDEAGHTIFIDEDRRVWTYDPETEKFTPTNNVLPELNPNGSYNSYYIDPATGNYQLSGNN